ncbi:MULTISPECIES: hypothetical protein [Nocardia]|uniref:hypothetical protein n=1 Tax=Nocardia TaxID=1817 RepID=UPI001895B76D|nr:MULTISPECIES: hypothetical protein [Nocardia]MBF6351428.1 hypothetical protein [Nocardia flavorosea]
MNPPEPEYFTGSATSRTGLVTVQTTELGLPTAISVYEVALRGDPHVLADEIKRLCRQSANRARLARRNALVEAGADREVLDRLGLPTAAEVALAEEADEQYGGYDPGSWVRGSYG